MFFTRCLSCKISLWRDAPFRIQDRVCRTCMDRLRSKNPDPDRFQDSDSRFIAPSR